MSLVRQKEPMAYVIGEIGKWQLQNIAIVFVIGIPGLAHIFSSVFVAAKTDYWCADDLQPGDDPLVANISKNKEACRENCTKYEFDHSFWENTIIMEWDLTCGKSDLSVLAKMVFFSGFAAGTFGAGLISDTYGRRSAIILMSQLLFGAGILSTTMPSYTTFVIMWFFTGVAAVGVYTVCFVWAMESVSGRWKSFMGMGMNYGWPLGRFLVPCVAYFTRDWKVVLQVLSGLHIFSPLLMNFVPESPRWLLATSKKHPTRKSEARDILAEASTMNGMWNDEAKEKVEEIISHAGIEKKRLGFIDLFRSRVLRKRTLVMYFNWFTNSFILYGLSLNWQSLTGSLFTNFLIGAALDFPAKTIALILVIKCGRRWPYICCVTGSGLGFLMMMAFERGVYVDDWPIVVCAMIGNLCISITFAIIWLYTPELFPTNIRNAGLGSCSLVARIGGVLATTMGRLAEVHIAIPTVLFTASALLSGLLSLMLPETAGKPLPDTIEECEQNDSKTRARKQPKSVVNGNAP